MSLRTRFIALFTLLAVIPLVGVGIFAFVRSLRAVEALVATQVEEIARYAARQVGERYTLHQSNLLLLAQNSETQELFTAQASGDPVRLQEALATAGPYLDYAWQVLGTAYEWIEIRRPSGEVLYRLGTTPGGSDPSFPESTAPTGTRWLTLEEPVLETGTQREIGTVMAAVIPDAILPYDALETRFGSSGYSVVLDRGTGRVLYHPRHALWQRNLSELTGPTGWDLDPAFLDQSEGTFTYWEADSLRVAYFQSLRSPPWTVLATGSVDEFGAPFLRARTGNLVLILFLALAVAGAYALLTRRATRSLVALTQAADRVGAGDLNPELPEAGGDEVGRLAGAFRVMVERVRESLRQMEASRQMAAVGQFASQISHEIRNPLTSMNLNLQGLKRDVERGRIPKESARPVELCLKEVQRLDRVVGGVLSLARPPAGAREACSIHAVIHQVLDVLQEQFVRGKVEVETDLRADEDTVRGEPEALEALFLNLSLNAVEAMPQGGRLRLSTEPMEGPGAQPGIRVRVADDGPGIPPQVREEIFGPFFTTKKDGTGLGLSLAARIAENHGGDLKLLDPSERIRGSEFAVELPIARNEGSE
jgi:signal transduction histidine kinase